MNEKEIIKLIEENIESWLHNSILTDDEGWELWKENFMKEVKKTLKGKTP